jgi:hypothetical protein
MGVHDESGKSSIPLTAQTKKRPPKKRVAGVWEVPGQQGER